MQVIPMSVTVNVETLLPGDTFFYLDKLHGVQNIAGPFTDGGLALPSQVPCYRFEDGQAQAIGFGTAVQKPTIAYKATQ